MPEVIYLNGRRVAQGEACVSIDDRGFLFGDAVYEVLRAYHGRIWGAERHYRRLARSLGEVEITGVNLAGLQGVVAQALAESEFADANIYVHITRGAEPRSLAYHEGLVPTVLVMVRDTGQLIDPSFCQGVRAITLPDLRWKRCDIKSTNLLPNALARQAARRAGAYEAILYDAEGRITEAASMSVFGAEGGALYTSPAGPEILPSVTREFILEIAQELGIPVRFAHLPREQFARLEEIFLSSTSHEVCPVLALDGKPVGTGAVGPVARRIRARFEERIAAGDDAPR